MLQKSCYWFLVSIPFAVAAGGFALPALKPVVYIPIWIMLVVLMLLAFLLTGRRYRLQNADEFPVVHAIPALLSGPWLLLSVFFGFGPPPSTVEAWVSESGEQQLRYGILLFSGVLVATGFTMLALNLKRKREMMFSTAGLTAILLAAPLYIINMAFWGSFLGEAFKGFADSGTSVRPDWYLPVRSLFEWIGTTAVALIYVATGAFAISLKNSNTFKRTSCNLYLAFSIAGVILSIFGQLLPGPFTDAGFFVSIPAIPLVMPYLMGINLLGSGSSTQALQRRNNIH